MGGSDDPSNLVELTVEEHAEAHRKLFEQHGKEEDRMAWLALSGQASKPEVMRLRDMDQNGESFKQKMHRAVYKKNCSTINCSENNFYKKSKKINC
jgi:5S rRNA maturation endonuclease (ribonuclease M5)